VSAPKAPEPKAKSVAPPAPARLAKAAPDPKAHRLELAQAAAAKAVAHKLELAQAQQAKAIQAAQAAKAAKTLHQHQIELAKAEAKGRAEARAEAKAIALAEARDDARKKARLLALAQAVQKLMPHQAKPAPVQLAKAERKHAAKTRHEPRIEQASLKSRKAPPRAAPPAYRVRAPQPPPPPQHASGLMKVSDPGLGAAERQLNRAYQDARAAGVPDAQLQRQQQRWLAARQAAAREAPWAVHDVYLARIAELNGQAREARPDGY
jgi:colicin import membrane protein